jgi:folate-dependent tRNA-U54 methylase TrmFO/GidA
MRPLTNTAAHKTDASPNLFAALARVFDPANAAGLLKEEMRRLGSLVLRIAEEVSMSPARPWRWIVKSFHDG